MQGTQQSLRKGTILSGNSYNYKIEGILGQGSSGIAYLASIQLQGELGCLNTHTQVAIKEFFQKNFNGREGTTVTCSNEKAFKEYKTKFLREAKNLSKLKHPHIVDILEAFEANNTCYYVMEYLEGGSFDSYIKTENGLSESEALTCIRQIGEALQFMHNNRMLHLDLKPKNIMRRKDGSIVLIDFGLSKQYNSQGEPETSTAIGYGTPGYAPIEQSCYRDGEGFPITIDIYALGATLFKTLTGKTPPNASNIMNYGFPEAELQERNISNKTITAIQHAMKPEKNARTQTVETFIQEIEGGHAEDTILIEDNSLIVLPETNKITLSLEKVFMGSDRNFSTDIIITANSIALTVKAFTIPKTKIQTYTYPYTSQKFKKLLSNLRELSLQTAYDSFNYEVDNAPDIFYRMRFSLFSTKKSYADIKVEYEALDELRTNELPKNWHGIFSRLQRAITSQIPSFNETVLTVVSNKTPPEEGAKVISIAKESFMAIFAGVMTLMLIIGPNIGVGGIITITSLVILPDLLIFWLSPRKKLHAILFSATIILLLAINHITHQ